MKYVIIELQKFADGSVAIPPVNTADTLNAARSTFYSKCAVAAVSDVPLHSVVLLNEAGQTYALESFDHTDSTN